MTNNHVNKWDHCFVCCCYFGLLWLFLRNHFGLLCTKYSPFSTSASKSWQQQLISSMVGEKLAHRLPTICDCTCQRTANYQQLAVAAVVSCSLQSCYLELHFKHACTHPHTHSGPGSYLPVSKPLCWRIATIFWWHEIPQFLNLGNTLHYINK